MENSSADESIQLDIYIMQILIFFRLDLIDEPQISYWNDQKTIQGQRTMATDLNTEFYKQVNIHSINYIMYPNNNFYQAQRLIAIRLMHKDRFTKEMVTIYNMTSGMIFVSAFY